MIIGITELSFSIECDMIVCMLAIALSLGVCNRMGHCMISAVRIATVTMVYGIAYGFMAITILTEETMLLGVLLAVLEAYFTVDGMIIPNSFMSLDGITCLMIYGIPALWLMAWKTKYCTVELLTVIMILLSAFIIITVIIGMIMSESIDILSVVTIIICGTIIVEVFGAWKMPWVGCTGASEE